jgi:hypothetical protein
VVAEVAAELVRTHNMGRAPMKKKLILLALRTEEKARTMAVIAAC